MEDYWECEGGGYSSQAFYCWDTRPFEIIAERVPNEEY